MSLQDCLERKRIEMSSPQTASSPPAAASAAKPHAGGVTSRTPDKPVESALLLHCWNREVWVFPWPCFTEGHFEPRASSDADAVRLVFGNSEVILHGRNLAELMQSIARHLLCEVREMPQEHATPADAESGAPVVWEIRVCERSK